MKKMILVGGALLALVAIGVVYLNYGPWFVFREKREIISDKLRDPESVQFRKERITSAGWLCGELNSKNGSGGYGGFKRFFVRAQNDAWLEGEGWLYQLETREFIELLDEKIAVNQRYLKLQQTDPNLSMPSESEREEQAGRQLFEKKWAATCL